MDNNDAMEQIKNSQMLQKKQAEYVVRGALTTCSNGEKKAVLNLPEDHGQYLQGNPQINTQDSKLENIGGFGICKLTNKKCVPQLSSWLNGNENKRIWNQGTLKMEATVVDTESYCVCLKNQGIISATNSGQTVFKQDPHSVYITTDRTAIVVNNIRFDIYNPNGVEVSNTVMLKPREEWYTLLDYTMTEKEFSLSKALLGFEFEMEDFGREEVSAYVNQTETYGNGKEKKSKKKVTFVPKNPSSKSKETSKELLLTGIWIVNSVLQRFADAVEYTYVTFYFQKSNTGKHRVVLLGGTSTDTHFYQNYDFYKSSKSYLYNVVPENMLINTRRDMKIEGRKVIEKYLELIGKKQSNARVLVEKQELWLKKDEYYDEIVYLMPKRSFRRHQVYLYSESNAMCQKAIIYKGESISIIKRTGNNWYGKQTKLIELSNCLETKEGSEKFWVILDKALKEQALQRTKVNLKDPSNATFNLTNIRDEIPKNAKPQSINDLIEK